MNGDGSGRVRLVEPGDRAEWLRMLMTLYERSTEADHVPSIDAYFSGDRSGSLLPAAVFVCERPDGDLAGFLELSVRNYAEGCARATPYVESWYVDPDLRGRGFGRNLMSAAEGWARARGHEEIASDAKLENVASHRAHRAVGFEEIERAVHFRKKIRAANISR